MISRALRFPLRADNQAVQHPTSQNAWPFFHIGAVTAAPQLAHFTQLSRCLFNHKQKGQERQAAPDYKDTTKPAHKDARTDIGSFGLVFSFAQEFGCRIIDIGLAIGQVDMLGVIGVILLSPKPAAGLYHLHSFTRRGEFRRSFDSCPSH